MHGMWAVWTWAKRHWRAVLGAATLIGPALQALRWIVTAAGDIDFIVTRAEEPGWVAVVLNFILNPPPWALLPFILIGLALILWDNRRRHKLGTVIAPSMAASEKPIGNSPPVEEPRPLPEFPNSMLIADLEMNLARVSQPAPWLDFHGLGFNGSGRRIIILSAAGRVRVDGAEFPQELTLFSAPLIVEPYSLFGFTMNLPLNDKGAEFIVSHPGTYSVAFLKGKLVVMRDERVINPEALPRYELSLPSGVSFTRTGSTARPQPTYLSQVGRHKP